MRTRIDGAAWVDFSAPVANTMTTPAFGLFAFGPQAAGVGDTVSFDYFTLDGQDAPGGGGCSCTGPGDDFGGASLDASKWNAIIRPDDSKVAMTGGSLNVTTVLGDVYTNSDATGTRNFILQTADHVGKENYVLETKVDVSQLNGGYAQGGLLVYTDDDNYVKFDAISDVNTPLRPHRVAVRAGGGDRRAAAAGHQPAGGNQVRLAAVDQDRHVVCG